MMGVLSALIIGPCVTAPLAGALLYIGQTGDVILGGAALFTLGFGIGAPLLIVWAYTGKLLPKSRLSLERRPIPDAFSAPHEKYLATIQSITSLLRLI